MPTLSSLDYRGVLDVLREAGEVEGADAFPRPVLEALRRLVPCDVVSYHERTSPLAERTIVYAGSPRGEMTAEIRFAERRYLHQDPLAPADGARKVSDFLSRREYHRTGLYQYADRPLGIEYLMRVWLDRRGAADARFDFDRGDRDFSERDRAVLDLLLPYLRQIRRLASMRRPRGAVGRQGEELTRRQREILCLVAEGRTNAEVGALLRISPHTVRKHLENAYERLGVHTRTGAVAAAKLLS